MGVTVGTSVDEYLAGLPEWQREIADSLSALVADAVPEADYAVKWGQLVFTTVGPRQLWVLVGGEGR